MALNTALKTAFFEQETTQVVVAKEAGIPESRMSKIVRGHVDPTPDEKKAIAKALHRRVAQIFSPDEAIAS